MVPEVGIAPTSPPLQGGANLPQLLGVKMVVPAGDAPASSGYRPGALLLSYRTMADGVGFASTQPGGSLGFRDRGITALPTIRNGQGGRSCTCDLLVPNPDTSGLLTLHPEIGCQGWTRTNTERLNRPPCYFDTTWQ